LSSGLIKTEDYGNTYEMLPVLASGNDYRLSCFVNEIEGFLVYLVQSANSPSFSIIFSSAITVEFNISQSICNGP
jgi:hypothetical protein